MWWIDRKTFLFPPAKATKTNQTKKIWEGVGGGGGRREKYY